MQIIVTPEQISFKRPLYTINIPRQSNIQYIFHDYKNTTSLPLALELKSDDILIKSKMGFIGKLFYYYQFYVSKFLFKLPTYGRSHFSNSPTIIYTSKKIQGVLTDLSNNGYNVKQQIQQLNEITSKPFPKELTPGTTEWKKDKFKLIIVVFLFFEFFIVKIFLEEPRSLKTLITFFFVSLFFFLLCLLVYRGLAKIKK
ncbi:MAG: hypothetical protein ABIJ83_04150 [Patescibacteria group bacterium]